MDMRGHGHTITGNNADFELESLAADVIAVVTNLFHSDRASPSDSDSDENEESIPSDLCPPVVLVGHSLGGAVVTKVASMQCLPILGTVVIDAVEAAAKAAMSHMSDVVNNMPKAFETPAHAVLWAITKGPLKNVASARISVPDQLLFDEESKVFRWRTSLLATEPHWNSWFEGLSKRFVSLPCRKLLVLAHPDRLQGDTDITIASMQGKLQLLYALNSGHHIQEDCPETLANYILAFCQRCHIDSVQNLTPRK
jgi:protein phosphatase methylesterase 1